MGSGWAQNANIDLTDLRRQQFGPGQNFKGP